MTDKTEEFSLERIASFDFLTVPKFGPTSTDTNGSATVSNHTDPSFEFFYLIDIDIFSQNANRPLEIIMVKGWKYTRTANESTVRAVQSLLAKASSVSGRNFNRRSNPRPHKWKTTPTSFHIKEDCYVIFRVLEPRGLRYTRDFNAFSFDPQLVALNLFSFVNRVDDGGNLSLDVPSTIGGTDVWEDDRRMMLVAYNGARAPADTDGNFVGRFNLHLDVLHDISDQSGAYTPLIVDPDVRFPGGNAL